MTTRITTSNITDATVATADLSNASVTNTKLSSTSVTSSKMANLVTFNIIASDGSTVLKTLYSPGN